jgi:hypothetical protein
VLPIVAVGEYDFDFDFLTETGKGVLRVLQCGV